MGILEGREEAASSSTSRTIPRQKEDDTMAVEEMLAEETVTDVIMDDVSSQAGIDRMVLSITADEEVSKRIMKTWHDIEKKKRSRK